MSNHSVQLQNYYIQNPLEDITADDVHSMSEDEPS